MVIKILKNRTQGYRIACRVMHICEGRENVEMFPNEEGNI